MKQNAATTPVNHNATCNYNRNIVWAVNVGGKQYIGTDNICYESDELALASAFGRSEHVKGSQDAKLYHSFREGEMSFSKTLPNGTYAVTLKFAEPYQIDIGERVFDVYMQDKLAIGSLDVRLARDGNPLSSLDRTAFNIEVTDGELSIDLKGKVGTPVLHAIVVREQDASLVDWELIWQDEFDYQGSPDPSKWSFDEWPARKVNDEDQTYTNRDKNARVEDGRLIIEAHKEQFNGAEYTSARLHTAGKMDLLYGRIDVRAKLPAGQGTWAAIWMLPTDPYKYSTSC